jgi:hypothetical protein
MASLGARTASTDALSPHDGRVLTGLAEIDSRLRELDQEWTSIAQKVETSRRELAVAAVELQRARLLAARRARGEDREPDEPMPPPLAASEEAHHVRLFEHFEAELREAEARRIAIHNERQTLRKPREAARRQLSAAVRSAYEWALQAGRIPVLTAVADEACVACGSRLNPAVVEAVGRGDIRVCAGCARILCPSR